MRFDKLNMYSESQALTATAASTNSLDHGEPRNLGVGQPVYVVVVVTVAFTDGSSDSTCTVTVETDDNTGFSSATTAQTIGVFAALTAAGSRLIAALQPNQVNERYSQLKYTMANGSLTTGTVTAGLVYDYDAYTAYADAVTIH
jgi:hypothetical protein